MKRTTSRRRFFAGGLGALLALGVPGALRARVRTHSVVRVDAEAGQEPGPEARLKALGLELPPPPRPIATYVPAVIVGNLLFVAGHTPRRPDGSPSRQGKVGRDLTLEEAQEAARFVALNVLATMKATLGSLDRVVRLVRTFGMVNAVPDFAEQPQVINGFSDLMVQIFGETAGKGARAAVGMGSLPSGMPVEIETIWEVRS
ncbi:MAG: RidA family protein [Gemmatimonadetes bacterium]|nr:RidA family protein [Gemmatimonadota bacterium]